MSFGQAKPAQTAGHGTAQAGSDDCIVAMALCSDFGLILAAAHLTFRFHISEKCLIYLEIVLLSVGGKKLCSLLGPLDKYLSGICDEDVPSARNLSSWLFCVPLGVARSSLVSRIACPRWDRSGRDGPRSYSMASDCLELVGRILGRVGLLFVSVCTVPPEDQFTSYSTMYYRPEWSLLSNVCIVSLVFYVLTNTPDTTYVDSIHIISSSLVVPGKSCLELSRGPSRTDGMLTVLYLRPASYTRTKTGIPRRVGSAGLQFISMRVIYW